MPKSNLESSPLYRREFSVRIPVRIYQEILKELPSAQWPFTDEQWEQFAVAAAKSYDDNSFLESLVALYRISNAHGRSFDISDFEYGSVDDQQPLDFVFSDEFWNDFWEMSLKGGDATQVGAICSKVEPGGFRYKGLLTHRSLIRCLRGSKLLRRAHVSTEIVMKVMEPIGLPLAGEVVDIPRFKQFLIDQAMSTAVPEVINADHELRPVAKSDIPALIKDLDETTFFLMLRGMTTNIRMKDFSLASTKDEFLALFRHVATIVNFTQLRTSQRYSEFQPYFFNPDDEDDVVSYFTTHIPQVFGCHLAVLSDLGLLHQYLNPSNMIADGGIADLDSMKGPALGLGDQPNTNVDILLETMNATHCYQDLLYVLAQKGFIEVELTSKWPRQNDSDGHPIISSDEIDTARAIMYLSYLTNCHTTDLESFCFMLRVEPLLLAEMMVLMEINPEMADQIWTNVSQNIPWFEPLAITAEDLLKEFAQTKASQADKPSDFERIVGQMMIEIIRTRSGALFTEYQEYAIKQISLEVIMKYGEELSEITQKFGEDVADVIQNFMTAQEAERIMQPLLMKMAFVLRPPAELLAQLPEGNPLRVLQELLPAVNQPPTSPAISSSAENSS